MPAEIYMQRDTVCFLVGNDKNQLTEIESAIGETGCRIRRINDLDNMDANRFDSTRSGCLIVDNSSIRNATSRLVNFFLANRVWLPIVELRRVPTSSEHLHSGACVTLCLPTPADKLVRAVRYAISRDVDGEFAPSQLRCKMLQLTEKEKETIKLLLHGHNTKAVANTLNVTYQTVDKHKGRALRKLGMRNVIELQNTGQRTMLRNLGLDVA